MKKLVLLSALLSPVAMAGSVFGIQGSSVVYTHDGACGTTIVVEGKSIKPETSRYSGGCTQKIYDVGVITDVFGLINGKQYITVDGKELKIWLNNSRSMAFSD